MATRGSPCSTAGRRTGTRGGPRSTAGCGRPAARSGSGPTATSSDDCRERALPARRFMLAAALTRSLPEGNLGRPTDWRPPTGGAQRERTGMKMLPLRQSIRTWAVIGVVAFVLVLVGSGAFVARAADPIKIGLGMALTGGLSANGKPALLALQIWKDDVN